MLEADRGAPVVRSRDNWLNRLEPRSLIDHFLQYPPAGFEAYPMDTPTPAFTADFDLTTTLEPGPHPSRLSAALRRLAARILTFRTLFVGTTVSEYVLLPRNRQPNAFEQQLREISKDFALLIIKDIPVDARLVGDEAAAYSGALIEACKAAGYIVVEGQALAYVPLDFENVSDFLARMPRARRRDIRRKLRSAGQLDVRAIPTGAAALSDDTTLREMYALYLNVYEQSTIHFDRLTPEFFRAVLTDAQSGGVVFTYRVQGRLIGYNLCFECHGMLLDKYVGFVYPDARAYNLYCVSWFNNIQYALQRGLKYYVAGWTDPEIKRHLGASFTFTRHAVYVRNRWLRRLLAPFKHHFEADAQWLQKTR